MSKLDASMKVRDRQLEGFKRQAPECISRTKEKDTRTLRYDWFLSRDGTECKIHEEYVDSDGLLEHRANIGESLDKRFSEFADDHRVMVFGHPSPELLRRAGRAADAGNGQSGTPSSKDSRPSASTERHCSHRHGRGSVCSSVTQG